MNDEQYEAANSFEGAFGVIAAAGSGKSLTLLERVDNLINKHNADERDILVISFTRNTADELKGKLSKLGHDFVNVGTFHSICMRILVKEGIDVSPYKLIKDWQVENCFKEIDQKVDVKDVKNFISYQKNYMRSYDDEFKVKDSAYTEGELRTFFKAYEDFKKEKGLYDFDDYMLMCLEAMDDSLNDYSFEYVMVDEHQDSNLVQNKLLEKWCQSGNIFVVGDVRQSIYSFRGSEPQYFMDFDKHWKNAKMINLHMNYRSANNIVEQSNHFIRDYYKDYDHYKDAEAFNKEDGRISVKSHVDRSVEAVEVVDEIEDLINQDTPLNEIAVLYRLNKHVSFVEAELKSRGIEYDIANDSSFFKRTEVAAIIAYLRLIHNVHDDSAFTQIFKLRNEPLKFFSNKVFKDIQTYAGNHNMSLYESFITMEFPKHWMKRNSIKFETNVNRLRDQIDKDVSVITLINNIVKTFNIKGFIRDRFSNEDEIEERIESINVLKSFVKNNNLEQFITYVYTSTAKKKKKENAVRLMSVHKSKGLEFDTVFVIGVEDEQFPHDRAEDPMEEIRLFYVAITRPRWNLYLNEIGKGNKFIKEYGYK